MELGTKQELTRFSTGKSPDVAADRPPSDYRGKSSHISLRVAPVHAKRMQLEGFPCEVLIDTNAAAALTASEQTSSLGVRPNRHVIVEVQQHGRMPLDGKQHVREAPKYIRTNCFALQTTCEAQHDVLVDRHCKVIRPEVRQPFDERTISANGLTKSRAGFGYIDGPIDLPDFRECGEGVGLIGRVRRIRRL